MRRDPLSDVSERKKRENQVRLLLSEVNHRAKNMLSLVLAIANGSSSGDDEEFLDTFQRRIFALAANQDLLVSGDWIGVSLNELIRTQLAHLSHFLDDRITLCGPALILTPKASETLGMAIHELATNAAKHGALSNGGGEGGNLVAGELRS